MQGSPEPISDVKIIYKAGFWDCNVFYIDETNDFMKENTEYFKAIGIKRDHSSAIADHVKTTGLNVKWSHLEIFSLGQY